MIPAPKTPWRKNEVCVWLQFIVKHKGMDITELTILEISEANQSKIRSGWAHPWYAADYSKATCHIPT